MNELGNNSNLHCFNLFLQIILVFYLLLTKNLQYFNLVDKLILIIIN